MLIRNTTFVIAIFLFTVLTQVGGIVLLISKVISKHVLPSSYSGWRKYAGKALIFILCYALFSFLIVPPLARIGGRIPLPVWGNKKIKPQTLMTCILNRHYVHQDVFKSISKVSDCFDKQYPHSDILYLDANFPFFDGFPLLPHLSHNDGKKLDVALFYKDRKSDKMLNDVPSIIGYGVYEAPQSGEENMPDRCMKQGYWQYSFLENIIPQGQKENMTFDLKRTTFFVRLLTQDANIKKIFIEPHLKRRMRLKHSKIRFHGCHAVRHDDHIHFQI